MIPQHTQQPQQQQQQQQPHVEDNQQPPVDNSKLIKGLLVVGGVCFVVYLLTKLGDKEVKADKSSDSGLSEQLTKIMQTMVDSRNPPANTTINVGNDGAAGSAGDGEKTAKRGKKKKDETADDGNA